MLQSEQSSSGQWWSNIYWLKHRQNSKHKVKLFNCWLWLERL